MSTRSGPDPQNAYPAVIKVLGVGGAGCDAVNRMVQAGIGGVEFVAVNTDRQVLRQSKADGRIEIGGTGLGAGGDPGKGRDYAEKSADDISQTLEGADMVFVTAGMGGGTGTGAAPVVARIAKSLGALTVGVVTRSFEFEGELKQGYADQGIAGLREHVDSLVVIRLDRLYSIMDQDAPMHDFYAQASETLRKSVQAITDVITTTGVANVDFADIRSMMEGAGEALMGIGEARGAPNSGRAIEAANLALHSPLLADVTIAGAKGIIVNITGGKDITGYELREVMTQIKDLAARDATIKFGQVIEDDVLEQIRITVIATKFPARIEGERTKAERLGSRSAPAASPAAMDMPAYLRRRPKKLH